MKSPISESTSRKKYLVCEPPLNRLYLRTICIFKWFSQKNPSTYFLILVHSHNHIILLFADQNFFTTYVNKHVFIQDLMYLLNKFASVIGAMSYPQASLFGNIKPAFLDFDHINSQ